MIVYLFITLTGSDPLGLEPTSDDQEWKPTLELENSPETTKTSLGKRKTSSSVSYSVSKKSRTDFQEAKRLQEETSQTSIPDTEPGELRTNIPTSVEATQISDQAVFPNVIQVTPEDTDEKLLGIKVEVDSDIEEDSFSYAQDDMTFPVIEHVEGNVSSEFAAAESSLQHLSGGAIYQPSTSSISQKVKVSFH